MAKITPLADIVDLQNELTAVAAINANSAKITTAINNTLSRDGSTPNNMGANLDMNSFRVINVPDPTSSHDSANKEYVDNQVAIVASGIQAITSAGAVASTNVLYPEQFGAIGNGVTDDFPALQNWLTSFALTGKVASLTPGKTYYSNGNLVLTVLASNPNNLALYGYGASIKTNPALFQTMLTVRRNATTRQNESRWLLIEGFTFDQLSNPKSVAGISIEGAPQTIVRNCNFVGGSDVGGFVPYANQTGIRLAQSDPLNFSTGSINCLIENNNFHDAAVRPPFGITIEGQCNGSRFVGNTISADTGILMTLANAGIVPGDDLPNGIIIRDNSFEDCLNGINVSTRASHPATCQGLQVQGNRLEAINTAFFVYNVFAESNHPPIIGPNFNVGIAGAYVSATFNVDIRDTLNGKSIINPANLNPGDTITIGPISVPLARVGDFVYIRADTDLQGVVATGYVSSLGNVTVRLSNSTSGAVNLPGMTWYATVRPAN